MSFKKHPESIRIKAYELLKKKHNVLEAAKSLKISMSTLYTWLRMDFMVEFHENSDVPEKERQQFINFYAEKYNVTRNTIKRWIKDYKST